MTTSVLKISDITKATRFNLKPDADEKQAIAERLNILGIRKLTFTGEVAPTGSRDFVLHARIGATVVQACVVTLEPVISRIDEDVTRQYLADLPEITDAAESEMPDDDTQEPLPELLDLSDAMEEALALALPPWPRADGVEAVEISVAAPGETPLSDDDVKPFAALKSLKNKLSDTDEN
ncbi:MAG: DUF177 domain-containing protein [Boseongicola sp.]|nr:MAG: DUF177 domain-containing protein [Boseongicola sp.]